MGIFDSIHDALRFKDTIIYKSSSDLQDKYDALKKLVEEYPNNKDIGKEFYYVKKGLDGENEIEYQLKKSNIGMYVLRDINVKYNDLTAQIDYVIITPCYTYYVECKNMIGNIIVDENGNFIREYNVYGNKYRKGIPSPLRQVEAQREVIRKIWEEKISKIKKLFASKYFDYYRRVLVVASNKETILNTSKAPKDIKNKIIRADTLVRTIENDIKNRDEDEIFESQKGMEETAQSYINLSIKKDINYYNYYKNKYINDKDNHKEENNNDKAVILYHVGSWYKVYGDGAKIVSFLTDYKLFENIRTKLPTVGFPEYSIDNVIGLLRKHKINYILKNDDNKLIDYQKDNNYDKFLYNDLPYSHISSDYIKKIIKGSFKVQFEGEEVQEFVIGEDINQDAELVKRVISSPVNSVININEYKVKIIEKNIEQ